MKFFEEWLLATQKLGEKEKGRLIDALASYATSGGQSGVLRGNEDYVFPVLRSVVDEDLHHACTARSNGQKGGRPKKNPSVFYQMMMKIIILTILLHQSSVTTLKRSTMVKYGGLSLLQDK